MIKNEFHFVCEYENVFLGSLNNNKLNNNTRVNPTSDRKYFRIGKWNESSRISRETNFVRNKRCSFNKQL